MLLRSGQKLSKSQHCTNPFHKQQQNKVKMATVEEMTTLNDKLITALKESFDQLHTSVNTQGQQSHTDLLALESSLKEKESTETKSASSLGRMPTFSGVGNDAQEFIEQFQFYANFCKWNEKERFSAFPLALTGNARIWFFTLDQKYSTFDDLIRVFRNRFLSKTDEWVLRRELSERKQRMNESVMDFSVDIVKRCQRLAIPKTEQLHMFIQALLPELRDFVILREPKTLEEAVNIARVKATIKPPAQIAAVTKKDLDNFQHSMLTALSNVTTAVASANVAAFDNAKDKSPPDRMPGLETMIQDQVREEIRRQNFRANQNNNSNLRFTRNGGFGRPTRAVNGDVICQRCLSIGHHARYCNRPFNQNRQGNRMGNYQSNPGPYRAQQSRPAQLNIPGGRMNGNFVPPRH